MKTKRIGRGRKGNAHNTDKMEVDEQQFSMNDDQSIQINTSTNLQSPSKNFEKSGVTQPKKVGRKSNAEKLAAAAAAEV